MRVVGYPHMALDKASACGEARGMRRLYKSLSCVTISCAALATFPMMPAGATTSVTTVVVGTAPWGVAITPDGSKAYIGNSGSSNVSVVNLASATVQATISTGNGAAGVTISHDGQYAYVTNFRSPYTLSTITTSTNAVTSQSADVPSYSTCLGPLYITTSTVSSQMYYACDTYLLAGLASNGTKSGVSLAATYRDIATLPSNGALLAVDATHDSLWFASGGSSVAVGAGATSLAITPDSSTAIVGSLTAQTLSFVDIATRTVTTTLTLGGTPEGIAINPSGTKAYVTDGTNNRVLLVDLSSRSIVSTIALGTSPLKIALTPDGRTAVVTNNSAGTISIIALPADEASGSQVPTAPLQQYARHEGASCEGTAPAWVDFPGLGAVLHEVGWGQSWAQWPNGGTGGFVCTRQPYYTTSGTWAVR